MSETSSDADDNVTIRIVFDYVIQRVPTRNNRKIETRKEKFGVNLTLKRSELDANGFPKPGPLWFAERMFFKNFDYKSIEHVRILRWQARLDGNPKVLSEYQVLLSPSLD